MMRWRHCPQGGREGGGQVLGGRGSSQWVFCYSLSLFCDGCFASLSLLRRVFCRSLSLFCDGYFATVFHSFATGVLRQSFTLLRRVFCDNFSLFCDGCFATVFHSFATCFAPIFHSFVTGVLPQSLRRVFCRSLSLFCDVCFAAVFHSFATGVLPQSFTLFATGVLPQSFTLLRQPFVLHNRSSAVSTDQKGERMRPQWGAKRAVIWKGRGGGGQDHFGSDPPPHPTPPIISVLALFTGQSYFGKSGRGTVATDRYHFAAKVCPGSGRFGGGGKRGRGGG